MANESIITKLLDHDRQFETLRDDIRASRDTIMTTLDQSMVILMRLDQYYGK